MNLTAYIQILTCGGPGSGRYPKGSGAGLMPGYMKRIKPGYYSGVHPSGQLVEVLRSTHHTFPGGRVRHSKHDVWTVRVDGKAHTDVGSSGEAFNVVRRITEGA